MLVFGREGRGALSFSSAWLRVERLELSCRGAPVAPPEVSVLDLPPVTGTSCWGRVLDGPAVSVLEDAGCLGAIDGLVRDTCGVIVDVNVKAADGGLAIEGRAEGGLPGVALAAEAAVGWA